MAMGGASRRAFPTFKAPASSRSKAKARKRRGLLLDILTRQLRTILFFVGAIFIIAVFKVGIPASFSKQAPASFLPVAPQIGFNLSEAQVDLRMKDLYDRIEFKNEEGGPWRQGWPVKYTGDEWDTEKLKVFVVPHSHNDPGWLRTVEEYYQERSRRILSTIVQALAKDKKRKFIWEEMSYLERWWRDASDVEKTDFVRFVKNGQLEIVSGGWVMNDEANSHYFAIIEQMIEGNIWLQDNVGVTPKNAWAIDPFGHSPTMAYLFRRMGFQNMLIQRTHYEVKKALALEKDLEFLWRQSWDSGNTTDIFCHMMPFYSYDIPHTCGPEPAICCQFDYWRLPMHGGAQHCPWGYNPQEINSNNVQEMSMKLLDQYRKKSTLYKTNTLLVPLGDDFRYITSIEAELQYENYQKIFNYVNSHPELKAKLQFGTLEDYFSTLQTEVQRSGFSRQAKSAEVPAFPTLSGDFFTYADRDKDYWSGYYVSRPFYKAVDRVLEETLRASDILFSLLLSYCHTSSPSDFPFSFSDKLIAARRNLALFQHHDGVTGTAKDHVVIDYASRMHNSILDLELFMAQSMGIFLNKNLSKGLCDKKHLDIFEPEKTRSSYNMLPVKKALDVTVGNLRQIVLYNPLEEPVDQIAMVVVEKTSICVCDSELGSIQSQVSPEWSYDGNNITTGRHRLHWRVSIPPLGSQSYFIANAGGSLPCKAAKVAQLKVFNVPDSFTCPSPYECSQPDEEVVEIKNQHHTLVFAVRKGLLMKMVSQKDGKMTELEEELDFYSSQGSGAYLFHPQGEAESLVLSGGQMLVTEGLWMHEVYAIPKTLWNSHPITRSTRLFLMENSVQALIVEMEYHIELLDNKYLDKEVVARFKTNINSGKVFFSDLNGFQMIRRETYDKIPLQGNYYPMPSLAFLQGPDGRRLSLHTHQALGVASLNNGWLEVMLDRRLSRDDDRGLGQGVLDNRPTNAVFHLLLESNITNLLSVSSSNRSPSLLSHRVAAQLNYPLHLFVSKEEKASNVQDISLATQFSALGVKFPCDLHIVSLKVLRPSSFLLPGTKQDYRFALLLQRRGWDTSYCRQGRTQCTALADGRLNLFDIFSGLEITKARSSTLNMVHDSSKEFGYMELSNRKQLEGPSNRLGWLDLSPMEIQAFKLDLRFSKKSQELSQLHSNV